MRKARKKPIEVEFITFDEFIEFGKSQPDINNIVGGVPWSFNYKGYPITHENDECYIIPTFRGPECFTPKHVLVTDQKGMTYPYRLDLFKEKYDIV